MKLIRKKFDLITTEEPRCFIHVYPELCKGCEICVMMCPKDILAIGDDLKVKVVNKQDCIVCNLCEWHCPDYAIFIEKKKKKEQK
ncbi:4Fe-4S ferredoxin [candidate division WOR-3 bacterium]|uniref:4Fe-4S ferredoxin n=1 Tax=candidate division WOR-3 bacterium TaxID=2052148 RepID=A0A9D5K8G4_UNCW3|nr:4Fe-4S ferredoxin [candidate division WOR-3 bacterium]MBD3364261.1 4Fe-4S ferredoxin [candidate division WOR-3 bacterium]